MATAHEGRVAFLQSNAINESLGLTDLAGHLCDLAIQTKLFIAREERQLPRQLQDYSPDLIVIPCDLLGHNQALTLARMVKNATSVPVVMGGTHPTFFPNIVEQPAVDYAFAGEAEGVVTDLLHAVINKKSPHNIPNLIYRENGKHRMNPLRPLVSNLDTLAIPNREIYYRYPFIARFPWKKFSTGRGCLNSCGYCFNPAYRSMCGGPKGFFRRKSPQRICREIEHVRQRHCIGIVHFSDDLFSSGDEWLESFAEVYRQRIKLPFSANVFATTINEKTVTQLRNAGCRVLAMGVEVASDRLRVEVMNKPVSTEQILLAAKLVRKAGIHLVTFNILGLPWSSPDQDIDTLLLNRQIKSSHTRVSIIVPFPKSKMTEMLMEERNLSPDFDQRIYEVADLPHWPAQSLFRHRDIESTMRLYRLWHLLLGLPLPKSWLRRLAKSKPAQILTPISLLLSLTREKKIFGLSWLSGFRYFLHVKSPALKTTNYVSFI